MVLWSSSQGNEPTGCSKYLGLSGAFVLWDCQQIKEYGHHDMFGGGLKIQHSMETAFLMNLKSARLFLLSPGVGGQDQDHIICYPWFVRTGSCCEGTER